MQIVSARINSDCKSFIKKDFHFEKRFNTRFWGGKPLAYRINFRLQNMSKQMTSNYTWRQTSSTFLTTNRLVTFQKLFYPFSWFFQIRNLELFTKRIHLDNFAAVHYLTEKTATKNNRKDDWKCNKDQNVVCQQNLVLTHKNSWRLAFSSWNQDKIWKSNFEAFFWFSAFHEDAKAKWKLSRVFCCG